MKFNRKRSEQFWWIWCFPIPSCIWMPERRFKDGRRVTWLGSGGIVHCSSTRVHFRGFAVSRRTASSVDRITDYNEFYSILSHCVARIRCTHGVSKNDTFTFYFCYCWIMLSFLLLHRILHATRLSCALYCSDMNLRFLQPEAYFAFVKLLFFVLWTNKQAMYRFKQSCNALLLKLTFPNTDK